ncbi:MAG: NTP transferase domain-containing protein [Bacteroidales bacterium]|nr:NTP transferase domain-containing protein [Bacteroidales bacterium]
MENLDFGVILAAGSGSRLYPLTKFFPKITLPIFDKPLIVHHFEILHSIGIKKVYIVVSGNNHGMITEVLKKTNHADIDYDFINQDYLGGTGHALWLLKNQLENSRFILLLGDEYYNDITSFKKIRECEDENILGIVEYDDVETIMSGCNVIINNNYITRLKEKPKENEIEGKWCWDGSVVLNPIIFEVLDEMIKSNHKEKGELCIVKAMQIMLDRNIPISTIKKTCANINITSDIDLLKANFIECTKKYDSTHILDILKKTIKTH